MGKESNIFNAQYLYGNCGRIWIAPGISVKVARITLGGLAFCLVLPASRGAGMGCQKSAGAIVGCVTVN